jgi:threonine/homoserine/homoserine lactone efflux protein
MAVHVVAASVGLSAVLASSAEGFGWVKLAGGAYLVLLGLTAIWRARRPREREEARSGRMAGSPFRDGLLSMALNPKAAVFFVAVVPQFVEPGPDASARVALLLLVYGAMVLVFWTGFVLAVNRVQDLVRRSRVRGWLERVTGCALVGLGVRLAAPR